jgi:hypothetical protein
MISGGRADLRRVLYMNALIVQTAGAAGIHCRSRQCADKRERSGVAELHSHLFTGLARSNRIVEIHFGYGPDLPLSGVV